MRIENAQDATSNAGSQKRSSSERPLTVESVADLQKQLADVEAQFKGVKHSTPEWDEIRKSAAAVRVKLFDLTGDAYGKPKNKVRRPDDELLNATYDRPEDIPADVLMWVRKSSLLMTDASDAVRWARILDTRRHERYDEGAMSIFRAVSLADEISGDIRPGDWVTSDRKYAEEHLSRWFDGSGTILEAVVNGRDVLVSPTGNHEEAIYAPLDLSGPLVTVTAQDDQPRKLGVVEEPELLAVHTAQFKQWFGASKVARWDGSPIVVYHGTRVSEGGIGDIQSFDRKFTQQAFNRAQNIDMIGSWFSDNHDADGAQMYSGSAALTEGHGGVVYPVYLAIQNPKVFSTFAELLGEFSAFHSAGSVSLEDQQRNAKKVQLGDADGFVDYMKVQGFDGIKITAHSDASSREFADQNTWIAFDAEQVRFALSPLVPRLAAEYAVLAIDNTATAAFDDIGRGREISLIMKGAAAKIAAGDAVFVLHDTNGNAVGRFELGARLYLQSKEPVGNGQVQLIVAVDHTTLLRERNAALAAVVERAALLADGNITGIELPLDAMEAGVTGVLRVGAVPDMEIEPGSMLSCDAPEV